MSNQTEIPYGYCHCGCGKLTNIAKQTNAAYGHIKGEPVRFCRWHNNHPPVEERFWANINKVGSCWLWTGINTDRYGKLKISGKMVLAHRYSYELHFGTIPDGLFVLHKCDTPACVNPDHLFLGTKQDNAADREQKGRGRDSRGDKKGQDAKLTEAKVRQIFKDYGIGMTQKEIGKKHGIAQGHVSRVLLKQVWAWLWK